MGIETAVDSWGYKVQQIEIAKKEFIRICKDLFIFLK